MKKVIFAITFLLAGAGCAVTDAPEVTKTKKADPESVTINEKKTMRHLEQHTDLAAEYSKAILKTSKGDITVSFYDESPVTVNNFMNLAQAGFYNGTSFHRIISDFMIQGGDPLSKDQSQRSAHGTGDPGYKFQDEFNDHTLVRGNLAMANSGPNTNGSQFFIVTKDETSWLDGKHTNFGEVVEGMDVVEVIEGVETDPRDNPIVPVVIESIELVK